MAESIMLVRLKPYNKRRGHLLRRLNYRGVKFEAHKGWYKVDADTAIQLSRVHQIAYDDDSAMAFDVMTQEEARKTEADEAKVAQEKAKASDPIDAAIDRTADLTTADLKATADSSGDDDGRKQRRARK